LLKRDIFYNLHLHLNRKGAFDLMFFVQNSPIDEVGNKKY
jgi:hypothetical protein